ncbi:glycosyl hydrolase, partial [Arachidicoccus sp.]|uniref:glycosyl hydrolase n=1 Tax=Arachidicoccus sp. TaxID=1872624 RepID=UPI003D224846
MKLLKVIKQILRVTLLLYAALLTACGVKKPIISNEYTTSVNLEKNFKVPPDSSKPWVYWYWINDNISKKGVTKDLEAMAKIGIGEAFIGNIGLPGTSEGKVPFQSKEWWQITKHAIHEGARTGVNIGLFNSPGWSQSGGPWIKPNEAMRYLVHKDWKVNGPQKFSQRLDVSYDNFQQVAILAFPEPKDDGKILTDKIAKIHCSQIQNISTIFSNDTSTSVDFPAASKLVTIDITSDAPFTARSLTLYTSKHPATIDCELQGFKNNAWQTIKKFTINRSNPNLNVGPMPYAPTAVSFPAVTTSKFRLLFSNIQGQAGLSNVKLSAAPKLEDYVEKQLGKMYPTPHPMWDAYEWPSQAEPNDQATLITPSSVINITKYLSKDGTLIWNVPKGNWIIESIGMTPTGVTNSPAVPEATGLEVDKMNTKDITAHFNAFVGRVLDSIAPQDKKAFKHVVEDSYETGSENWTDGFGDEFKKRYGYDAKMWLPVLSGRIIGSADLSNRFLWDMRRLIATNIAYKYVGGLRTLSEKHGMESWLENYGHWGFPSEFLMYGGQSNNISGEFWAEGDLGSIELRDASSAAHIYGKRQVWAESFTAGLQAFLRYPASLKKRGDWA